MAQSKARVFQLFMSLRARIINDLSYGPDKHLRHQKSSESGNSCKQLSEYGREPWFSCYG